MHTFFSAALFGTVFSIVTLQSWADDAPTAETNRFFHAEKINGHWWLAAPDGGRFISKGVTTVQVAQDTIQGTDISPYLDTNKAKYGNPIALRKAAATRLLGWGFNTLGAWSDDSISEVTVGRKRLAYAPIVDLGAKFVGEKQKAAAWLHGVFPDVFDPDFERMAHQLARERCMPRAGDRWLLGWFTDNELRWGPDWRGSDELLTMFL